MDDKTISIDVVKQMMADQAKHNAEMLREVIQELKKPTVLEQKQLDKEIENLKAANEERKGNAAGILAKMHGDEIERQICTHKHKDGNSHGVFVAEKAPSPGYIHCQKCHANIRPTAKPAENADCHAIYDLPMFNRMFQELPSSELFM